MKTQKYLILFYWMKQLKQLEVKCKFFRTKVEIPVVFSSNFSISSVLTKPHFPEFVEWCKGNFSSNEGVIMNRSKSKVLFPIQALDIHKSLHVIDEFFHTSQAYEEENIMHFFRESIVESREAFLKYCSKPNAESISLSYPIDLSLFNEESQWCITLASQFLGLDTNGCIMEPLLSLLFVLDTCPTELELLGQSFQSCHLKFDEFLAKNIHSQLANFHNTRVFRFQSFLLRLFLSYKEDNSQAPGLVINDDMTNNYYEFTNSLMPEIYGIFFQRKIAQGVS